MDMKKLRQWIAPILTLIMWVIIIMIMAVTLSFIFNRDEYFWTITGVGIVIMVLTNIIWSPTGIEMGENVDKVKTNTRIYSNRANFIVNNQLFGKLKVWCEKKNDEFLKDTIKHILARYQIDYKYYDEYVEKKKAALQQLNETSVQDFDKFKAQFTKNQIKCLEKLFDKQPKFEHLTPDDITKGHGSKNRLVPKNRENIYRFVNVAGKVIWGILVGIFTAMFVMQTKDDFGLPEVIQIGIWTFTILTNILTSIVNSYKSVTIFRNDYFVEKNDLCADFFDFCGIKVESVDNAEIKYIEQESNHEISNTVQVANTQ